MLRRRMMMGQSGAVDYSQMYLTFKALESGTFTFSLNAISYSLDGGSTWTELAAGTATPTIAAGQKICWKASGLTPTSNAGIGRFTATANFDVMGNVMSMQDGDNFIGSTSINAPYQFRSLFEDTRRETYIINAANLVLPATTLADGCYYGMFFGCNSLTAAPELPATTLAGGCYYEMFRACSSLAAAPELPATTLVGSCYYRMFFGCKTINTIKCLAQNRTAYNCTYSWVEGVASTGTFVKNPLMSSWPSGTSGIPSGWTVIDAT